MRLSAGILALALLLLSAPGGAARGEEFDINGPTVERRVTQHCVGCGALLVVTTVPRGAAVHCPLCGKDQPRLSDDLLREEILQICPACAAAMDVHDKTAGAMIRCASCGTPQPVLLAATLTPDRRRAGAGRLTDAEPVLPVEQGVRIPPLPPPADGETPPAGRMAPGAPSAAAPSPSATDSGREGYRTSLPRIMRGGRGAEETGRGEGTGPISSAPASRETLPNTDAYAPLPRQTRLPENRSGSAPASAPALSRVPEGAAPGTRLRLVAEVNGTPIEATELDLRLSYLLDQERRSLGPAADTIQGRKDFLARVPELRRRVVDSLVEEAVLLQEAQRLGVRVDEGEVLNVVESMLRTADAGDLDPDMLQRIRRQLVIEKLRERHAHTLSPQAPPRLVQDYYREHADDFRIPPAARLSAIVVYRDRAGRRDPRPASEILRDAADHFQREGSFAAAARQYSEDRSAFEGGRFSLGGDDLLPLEAFAAPVRQAIREADLQPGGMAGPVDLGHALAWIRVEERGGGSPAPLKEVYAAIEARLRAARQDEAFRDYVRKLRNEADVRIH